MPFRTRPHFRGESAQGVPIVSYKETSEGVFIPEESWNNPVLPPVGNFDLKAIIDSGLPIDKVNTKMIDGGVTFKKSDKTEKPEQINKE